jgi:hypothetical protein
VILLRILGLDFLHLYGPPRFFVNDEANNNTALQSYIHFLRKSVMCRWTKPLSR